MPHTHTSTCAVRLARRFLCPVADRVFFLFVCVPGARRDQQRARGPVAVAGGARGTLPVLAAYLLHGPLTLGQALAL